MKRAMDGVPKASKPPSRPGQGTNSPSGGVQPERVPAVLSVAILLGAILGTWMALEGLSARIFGQLPSPSAHVELWPSIVSHWNIDPAELGWPLVVVGTSWWGSLAGVWIRHRWGWPFAVILGFVSLGFLGPSTVIAACLLIILLLPGVRAWRALA